MRLTTVVVALAVAALVVAPVAAQSTTCLACTLIFTLLEQLENPNVPPTGGNPDVTCQSLKFCDGTCLMFNGTWPVQAPNAPTDGGVIDQRRLLRHRVPWGLRGGSSGAVPGAAPVPLPGKVGPEAPVPRMPRGRVVRFLNAMAEAEGALGDGRRFTFYDTWKFLGRFVGMGPCEDALNITCDISRVFDQHLPLLDFDGDNHAGAASLLTNGFRGADWRGRDCNDSDATVYPGRANTTYGPEVDHNCNGIFGSNATGSYESMFCSGANAPMGVAILGDSAAAHFHLPPQYLNAPNFNLSGVLELAVNEADWPQCSWSSGFRTTAECPNNYGAAMGSIYQRMEAVNQCVHRDYTNLGVNGARSGSMSPPGIVNSLQRSPTADAPLLTFLALIGNDVCNGHPGLGSMTTPAEFYNNTVATLKYLDTVLPPGSHVAILGLVDGRVLWDTTNTRTHPIGVTYPVLYDYLACSSATPCWGWMNSNAGAG